jgi:hypothetical protein
VEVEVADSSKEESDETGIIVEIEDEYDEIEVDVINSIEDESDEVEMIGKTDAESE